MLKKISLILGIPWMDKGRHEKIMVNIHVWNSSREVKKFQVMVRLICMPWRDEVGQRIDNGMSVSQIKINWVQCALVLHAGGVARAQVCRTCWWDVGWWMKADRELTYWSQGASMGRDKVGGETCVEGAEGTGKDLGTEVWVGVPWWPWRTVCHGPGDHKSEISTFGKCEEREAGWATGVGRELVGLRTSDIGGSRGVEGTREIQCGTEERVSKEERDVITRGRTDEGGSEMITWVPVCDPCKEDWDPQEHKWCKEW